MEEIKPEASKAAVEDFYMDDLVTGGETKHEVIQLVKQIEESLKTACFHLHKWKSNSEDILQEFSNEHQRSEKCFKGKENTRTIGLFWNSE